jgi:predicted alpha-1,2-mannosidase
LRKNALPGGIRDHAGYEFGTNASGGGMKYYVQRGYVPEDIPGKGMHKDGAAMTLEHAYEDWCLSQMAQAMGKANDAAWLAQRSLNYTNLWDASVKWMRPRSLDGSWLNPFAPIGKPGEFTAKGFCEASAAIYAHFVPQDMEVLIALFGGKDKYAAALNRQFESVAPTHFVAPHGQHAAAWVDYDNEPSTAMAHLFNFAGAPWLTQKWVREVQQQTYGDVTSFGGYCGDEDQGQLASVSALMAIGLFDVRGGAEINPDYQITSPIFDKVTIRLNRKYFRGNYFVITTKSNSITNCYIQSVKLDGKPWNQFWFPHTNLVNGGRLEIKLGPQPSRWAAESQLPP